MEYKKFKNTIALKLMPNDDVIQSIKNIAKLEKIGFAKIEGIGRVKSVTLAFMVKEEYIKKSFINSYELISLLGNITNNGILHLHTSISEDKTFRVFAGHLFEAKVDKIVEIFITIVSNHKIKKLKQNNFPLPTWNLK